MTRELEGSQGSAGVPFKAVTETLPVHFILKRVGNACGLGGGRITWEQRGKTTDQDEAYSRRMKEDGRDANTERWRWSPKIREKDYGKEK